MKIALAAVLAGLCALALATPVVDDLPMTQGIREGYHLYKMTDQTYLRWYKDILRLFKYAHQRTYYKDHVDIAKEWHIESHMSEFTKPEIVKEFLLHYRTGMLPRDRIFSVFHEKHLKEAILLFKLFYYAKDFVTFYRTAVWARYHINQGMFLYTLSVALIHRPDTYSMVLPPIYEIYPYYFFSTEVIHKAHYYKQIWTTGTLTPEHGYKIYANYTGWYLNVHPEQSLGYFTEDIGVNAYYYYYNLYRPFWLNGDEFHILSYNRGEEFYYFYQQLLARYYLERLSNDVGEIELYDYEDAFKVGYQPSMCYPNGMEFPERPNWAYFFTNYYNYGQAITMKGRYPYSYYLVKDYERRIRDAIDAGFVRTKDGTKIDIFTPTGFNMLGNIIEGNTHSANKHFYGHLQIFVRHLLGYSYQPLHKYRLAPSALEHFETSLRDPAFWMFFKRMILYFQKYKHHLPHYTYTDLVHPGVKVEDVKVDHLITYFDLYETDVTNAVFMNDKEFEHNTFDVRVRQWRLNHKPFTYKIHVVSEKACESVVRVFIGPKYDEFGRYIHIDENRLNFVEFDRFRFDLKSGQNIIERHSREILFSSDRTTYKQLYKWVMTGTTVDDLITDITQLYYSFPRRLLLPKGKFGGQVFQFYVIVTPYKPHTTIDIHKHEQFYKMHEKLHGAMHEYFKYPLVGLGVRYLDSYPLGFPFDKTIMEEYFYVPNSYFKDVVIYHKQMDHVDNYLLYHNKKGIEKFEAIGVPGTGVHETDMKTLALTDDVRDIYEKDVYDRDVYDKPLYRKDMFVPSIHKLNVHDVDTTDDIIY